MYEYAIMMRGFEHDGLHRGPWPLDECETWVQQWEDDLRPGQEKASGLFYVVKRPVGEWERE